MDQTDYKTTIKIEADTTGAEAGVKREASAFDGLSRAIESIKEAAAGAWQALSQLFDAIGAKLTSLVSQVKELHSTVADSAVEKAAKEAAAATENLTEKQNALNAELKRTSETKVTSPVDPSAKKDIADVASEANSATGAITATGGALTAMAGRARALLAPLTAVRAAISAVMRTMGLFYLAAEGVNLVVSAFGKLHEWITRTETAARELADTLERETIESAAANAASAYERLNKQIAESNRLERERNAILDSRKSQERALEDAGIELEKQREIAKLDPASKTYEADRAAVERKFASRTSSLAAERAREDASADAEKLYAEAESREKKADELKDLYDRQMRIADTSRERTWRLGMEARNGVEGAQERHDEAEAQWNRDEDAAQKTKEAMEALRREAESIRARAGEMIGGHLPAQMRDEATQTRLETEAKVAEARRAEDESIRAEAAKAEEKRESDKKAADEKAAKQVEVRETIARMELEKEREIAKLDPASADFSATRAELDRSFQRGTLETRREATAEGSAERMEIDAKLAALDNAEREAEAVRIQSNNREAEGAMREASAGTMHGSRLNEMGLGAGSGVQRVQEAMAESLRDLVKLGREQLEALQNFDNSQSPATFS